MEEENFVQTTLLLFAHDVHITGFKIVIVKGRRATV